MPESKTKESWIEKHVKCILERWQDWQGPLEASTDKYIEHLKEELGHKYDDQLKRSMFEMNYPTIERT